MSDSKNIRVNIEVQEDATCPACNERLNADHFFVVLSVMPGNIQPMYVCSPICLKDYGDLIVKKMGLSP